MCGSRGQRCWRWVGEAHLESCPRSSSSQRLALHPGCGGTGRLAAAPDQTLALHQPLPDQQGALSIGLELDSPLLADETKFKITRPVMNK